MAKDSKKGISERELDEALLARIGMGNYFQKQTISVTTTQENQKIIPIPLDKYDSRIYKFDVMVDGTTYSDYKYTIDETAKTIALKDDTAGIANNKKVDFIFQWNAYMNKSIESPTVYVSDCHTKVCTIDHNMKKYPHVQVLEVLYGAGIGAAGEYPAGAPSKMIYPRVDFFDLDRFDLYLNEEYELYTNPKLNRVAEGKYVVTFDAPCVKSLLILVDKFELFHSEEDCYIDSKTTPITNPVKGFVRNQVMYGNTLQNIWNVNNVQATWDAAGSKAVIEDKTQNMYKSTKYTVVNLSDKDISISQYNTSTSAYVGEIVVAAKSNKVITLDINVIIGSILGRTNWTSANYAELNNSCIILEGDCTGKILPTSYFSGIRSVGDDIFRVKAVNNTDILADGYSETINEYGVILRSIGAIRDEYDVDSGTVTRKIGVIRPGYDDLGIAIDSYGGRVNNYRIMLYNTCNFGNSDFDITNISDKVMSLNSTAFLASDNNNISTLAYFTSGFTRLALQLNIQKSKLTDISNEGIISYLKAANINVLYVLPTPTQEKVSYLPIKLNDDTKYIIRDNNISAEIEFSYPLNIKSSIDNLIDSINGFREDIQKISVHDKLLSEIKNDLTNNSTITNKISFGMNNVVKNTNKVVTPLKLNIKGKTLINIFGKDGNCENINTFNLLTASTPQIFALDSSTKVFGGNSIKYKMSGGAGNTSSSMTKDYGNILDPNKYYCLSGYVKSSDGVAIGKVTCKSADGSKGYTSDYTPSTDWKKTFVKFKGDASITRFGIFIYSGDNTVNAGYLNFDGVMLEEITVDQYNNSSFQPSPYVDSYTCLQNPYLEVRHDNLVRNGNGEEGLAWWTQYGAPTNFKYINNNFSFIASSWSGYYMSIPVKKNTDYYFSGNITGGRLKVDNFDSSANIIRDNGTFNSGQNSYVRVMFEWLSGTSVTINANSIMLIEGTVPPTSYKACKIERAIIEGKFTDDDSVIYENGEVTGLINWKHRRLLGKDYDWQASNDYVGYKSIKTSLGLTFDPEPNIYTTKYDGKMLSWQDGSFNSADGYNVNNTDYTYYISMPDVDTGWAETILPNNDEAKAFMNGWVATGSDGGRYIAWKSVIDGSYPVPITSSTVSVAYVANATTLVVADGTKFSAGDSICILNRGYASIASISGNTLTLTRVCGTAAVIGDTVIRVDNGISDTRILNYCKNNIAPGYEGYQLHYKLANPEPINNANTRVYGDIPTFDEGDNYLFIDSGIVVGEMINPMYWSGSDSYYINNFDTINKVVNPCKYKTENILTIYKNYINDTSKWNIQTDDQMNYGRQRALTLATNFNTSATYTVDYKILATIAPQISSNISCSFVRDILSTINTLQEEVGNGQRKNSVLDDIIAMSFYEKYSEGGYGKYNGINWIADAGSLYFQITFPFKVRKVCIPNITINNLILCYSTHGYASEQITSKVYITRVDATLDFVKLSFNVTDATTISNIKTYGISTGPGFEIIADCINKI